MAAEIKKCPWCSGEVLHDAEKNAIGHSYPECPKFEAIMAEGPKPSRTEYVVLNGKGNYVEKGKA